MAKKAAPKINLDYSNWRFFPWTENFKKEAADGSFDGDWERLIKSAKNDGNYRALFHHQACTVAATALAERLAEFPEIHRIALFGSVAKPPFMEPHPYSRQLRDRGVEIFHTPKDVDLAVWISSLDNLREIRRAMSTTLTPLADKVDGLCGNHIELFLFDTNTSAYIGRACHFKDCPRLGPDCRNQGCGQPKHLKKMDGFVLHPEAVSRVNSQPLFERNPTAKLPNANLFQELPTMLPEELIEKLVDSKDIRIERIVSTGHTSPPGFWYDQNESEWVVILQGEATLEFEDETRIMKTGDYVLIPPHRKHRVNSTSTKEPTVWLAVFFGKETKPVRKATKKVAKKKVM